MITVVSAANAEEGPEATAASTNRKAAIRPMNLSNGALETNVRTLAAGLPLSPDWGIAVALPFSPGAATAAIDWLRKLDEGHVRSVVQGWPVLALRPCKGACWVGVRPHHRDPAYRLLAVRGILV